VCGTVNCFYVLTIQQITYALFGRLVNIDHDSDTGDATQGSASTAMAVEENGSGPPEPASVKKRRRTKAILSLPDMLLLRAAYDSTPFAKSEIFCAKLPDHPSLRNQLKNESLFSRIISMMQPGLAFLATADTLTPFIDTSAASGLVLNTPGLLACFPASFLASTKTTPLSNIEVVLDQQALITVNRQTFPHTIKVLHESAFYEEPLRIKQAGHSKISPISTLCSISATSRLPSHLHILNNFSIPVLPSSAQPFVWMDIMNRCFSNPFAASQLFQTMMTSHMPALMPSWMLKVVGTHLGVL